MPWTRQQEKFMFAKHPDIAKRVTNEPGYFTKNAIDRRVKKNARKHGSGKAATPSFGKRK